MIFLGLLNIGFIWILEKLVIHVILFEKLIEKSIAPSTVYFSEKWILIFLKIDLWLTTAIFFEFLFLYLFVSEDDVNEQFTLVNG